MATILSELLPDWRIKTLNDYPDFPEPEETGDTYVENAILKAEAARDAVDASDTLFIADDAGLEIDALQGAPGVRSKRFCGEQTSFPQKMRYILSQLGSNRTARFQCCVAIAGRSFETKTFCSRKEGVIAEEPRGEHGFGYDPIFLLPELGKTYAELSSKHKNHISHRFLVLEEAARWLVAQFSNQIAETTHQKP